MAQTLIEKIVQKHAVNLDEGHKVKSGDLISIKPAHIMTHDNTGAVMGKFKSIGASKMANPRQPVFTLDHNVQDKSSDNLKKYASIERYVKENSRRIVITSDKKKYKGPSDIYKNNVNGVVWIGNEKENGKGTGSIISNKGEIITNWHVVGNAKKLHIWLLPDNPEKMDERQLMGESSFIATVINRNKRKDLALLKVEGLPKDIKIIKFGKTKNVPVGSTVYAIGHPSGEAWTFSSGMVTQIRPNYKWNYENSSHKANVIQHEVPTNPGNSGGPLLDEKGLMVGVNSFVRIDSELINFSVAIEEVEAFLKEEIKEDKPGYIIKKPTAFTATISPYIDSFGTQINVTSNLANGITKLQSDGANWQQIN